MMDGRWLYSCCFVGCCHLDMFNAAYSILVWLMPSFFSIHLVSVHVVHPYSSIDTTAAWKKLCFILLVRSGFHMADSLLIAVHAFASCVLMSFLVNKVGDLVHLFQKTPFSVEMLLLWLKHMYSVLSALIWRPMPPATHSRLWSRYLAWAGEFAWRVMSSA